MDKPTLIIGLTYPASDVECASVRTSLQLVVGDEYNVLVLPAVSVITVI